jgi:hypothetical protein
MCFVVEHMDQKFRAPYVTGSFSFDDGRDPHEDAHTAWARYAAPFDFLSHSCKSRSG